jgi:hypothetical protein
VLLRVAGTVPDAPILVAGPGAIRPIDDQIDQE